MLKIKKRISLAYLGEDYTDSFLEVYSLPVKDLKTVMSEVQKLQEDEKPGDALDFMIKLIKGNFAGGKVGDVVVKTDNLEDLPADVFITAFQEVTGNLPKAE